MRVRSKKLSMVERLFEDLPAKSRDLPVLEFGMKCAGVKKEVIRERLRVAKMLHSRKVKSDSEVFE